MRNQNAGEQTSLDETLGWRWRRWRRLPVQAQFEHVIILILSALIAVVVVLTIWTLAVKTIAILAHMDLVASTEPAVFQGLFGMMFTVIIALEFRRTLVVITERQRSVVHVRAVILIGMLAIVRKFIILDLANGEAIELFALATAILALGGVYWLVRDRGAAADAVLPE